MTLLLLGCAVLGAEPTVESVTGPVPLSRLGRTLVHEHVLVDFAGAAVASPERYDAEEVVTVMRPYLLAAKAAGVETIVECTPRHLGRDPRLLARLSRETGLNLITNTGLYMGRYLPDWAVGATVEQLAASWLAEATDGLDGTPIKPGFIKIAVDGPPISEVQRRIVRAAARTSLATGLPITMHCPRGRSALEALDLLAAEGCPTERLIVAHADSEPDRELHRALAERGAWLSYDGCRADRAEQRRELVVAAYREFPERLLISQDAGWYRVGEPRGGQVAPLDWLMTGFLPLLSAAGLGPADLERLLRVNPARALGRRAVG